MILRERDWEFDFAAASAAEKLDQQGVPLPEGMRLVDFAVLEATRMLLIEVKDPSAGAGDPYAYAQQLKANTLIKQKLTPKARDSYTYLHLMERDGHPFTFIVAIGLDALHLDEMALLALRERLVARIKQEGHQPWRRTYIAECVIVRLTDWNTRFPHYPATRSPTVT